MPINVFDWKLPSTIPYFSTIQKVKMLKCKTDVQRLSVTGHSSFHGI